MPGLCVAVTLFLASAATVAASESAGAALNEDDCAGLGWEKAELTCDTCDAIAAALKADENDHAATAATVADECGKCCTKPPGGVGDTKFVSAMLVYDDRFHGEGSTAIGIFMKKHAKPFLDTKTLAVRHVMMSFPKLEMMDASGAVEVVNVGSWDADLLREYLANKLAPA